MSKTIIANFGTGNAYWPECLRKSTVATFEEEDLRKFWESGDREGYIAYAMAHTKSAAGISPIKPVASRWFNLATIVSESAGDVWIHREKDELWWTITKPDPVVTTTEPSRQGKLVYVINKPAQPWSNQNKKGARLIWNALHPRAREFLFTEGTLQQLSPENSTYARALIDGDDLTPWHSQASWLAKEERAGKSAGTVYTALQRSAFEMARTAFETCAASNGQQVERTVKNKEFRFDSPSVLQSYLEALVKTQEGICALTSLPLQFRGEQTDDELLASLDRINSSGHYEEGNLQVVCRFANRWKSDSDDSEFRRLIRLVQAAGLATGSGTL